MNSSIHVQKGQGNLSAGGKKHPVKGGKWRSNIK